MTPGCSFLCYSDFVVAPAKDIYFMRQCNQIESFYKISEDVERLALATYFGQVASELLPEGSVNSGALRLLLNTYYVLSRMPEKNLRLIKAVFELRLLSEQGYMLDLNGCSECSETVYPMRFYPEQGEIFCNTCKKGGIEINESVYNTMVYILYTDHKKLYSFTASDEVISVLARAAEQYMISCLGKTPKSLEYLKIFKEL